MDEDLGQVVVEAGVSNLLLGPLQGGVLGDGAFPAWTDGTARSRPPPRAKANGLAPRDSNLQARVTDEARLAHSSAGARLDWRIPACDKTAMGSHDKLFKSIFSKPEHAITHFEELLPAELTAALDLPSAQLEPGSFVDDVFKERHTDLLYRVPWRRESEGEGEYADREVLLYVIFEHQSTPDALMPFRMLRYSVRIWDRWLQDHPEAKRLPPIFPLVLYHGEQDWTAAKDLSGLFDVEGVAPAAVDAIEPYLPKLRILLDEVARLPDDQIPGRGTVRLTLLFFKHGRTPEFFGMMAGWLEDFRLVVSRGEAGLRDLERLVEYAMTVNEPVSTEALSKFLAPLGDRAKEIPMTVGEQLREEGRREGRKEGSHERALEVARKALAKGMSPKDVAELTDLPLEEVQKLTH
jgi:predicted transposase YdaD